jgi:hypothetical protein
MECNEFKRIWADRPTSSQKEDASLEAHVSACGRCARWAVGRNRILRKWVRRHSSLLLDVIFHRPSRHHAG